MIEQDQLLTSHDILIFHIYMELKIQGTNFEVIILNLDFFKNFIYIVVCRVVLYVLDSLELVGANSEGIESPASQVAAGSDLHSIINFEKF